MKIALMTIGLLTFSSGIFAEDLNQRALNTLLLSPTILTGDVHSYETVESIYSFALTHSAKIANECEVMNQEAAKCILWINYPHAETALEYSVVLPGDKLRSSLVAVYRGD